MPTIPTRDNTVDPRPDLFTDSFWWCRLLIAAFDATDPGADIFQALHAARCCGAGIELMPDKVDKATGEVTRGKARIRRGAMSTDEYDDIREKWLLPLLPKLAPLLEALT